MLIFNIYSRTSSPKLCEISLNATMSSSTISLCFKLNPPQPLPARFPVLNFPSSFFQSQALTKYSHVCFTFSPGSNDPSSYGPQEESRWLREEQRWLREEQRWLREESRWRGEKEALFSEIQRLNLRVQELEHLNSAQQSSVGEAIANIARLLQVIKEGGVGKNVNIISESSSSSLPFEMDAVQEEEVAEVVVKEVVKVPQREEKGKKRATLKMGSEGDEVQAMQEALQKLGFYCGEEDEEFSSFSSGTERAVKTWQSTFDAPEDGIMSAELLERLYTEIQQLEGQSSSGRKSPAKSNTKVPTKNGANGAATAPRTETSEAKKRTANKGSETEVNVARNRVYLLGENRWEEPSRLTGKNKPTETTSKNSSGKTMIRCVTCRGEGHLLCMECDGSGEPNVEEQFMEWIDEGTKCPYCEGAGHIVCDVCQGRKLIEE